MSNALTFRLDDLKDVVRKWLFLEHDQVIDVIMATYIANRFNADPVWMLLIAPPSNSKTELLRSFDGHAKAHFISNLTPSTLVSGMRTKKGADLSLLPRLNDKLVVLKDFTSILSMRHEQRQEIIAQLREAYDGSYSKEFGNGNSMHWKGKFGLIGACTPVYDKHHAIIGTMGERFLLYRTNSENHGQMGLRAQQIVGREEEMRAEIRQASQKFIDQFERLEGVHVSASEDIKHMIVGLASFVAYARCPVERDYRNETVFYQPLPEGTPRLVKQLTQIGMGLALAHGKDTIDENIYQIIKKIGCDLIPTQRLIVLKYLWNTRAIASQFRWEQTSRIADAVNIPGSTTKLILEDLMVVGALNRQRGEPDGGRPPYTWQITDQLIEWVGVAEVFE